MTVGSPTAAVTAIAVLAALVLGGRLLSDLRHVPRGGRRSDSRRPEDVTVIIPARDEARSLPHLLASLRALSPAPLEVVVVDDSSQDATADLAVAGGATVVRAPRPPQGWTGKAWACHRGADAARGRLLLFLDADTVLAPEAVGGLLDLHRTYGGLVSVQPYHRTLRAYEQLSAYFNVVSLMSSGAVTRRTPPVPMAFGPCLFTAADDYRRAGGHAAVRTDILDDVGLATAYARAGLPVACAVGGSSVEMRMYPGGLGQLVEGWTKNIASGAAQADSRLAAASAAWVAAHFAVAVGTLTSGIDAVGGTGLGVGPLAWWLVAWALTSAQLGLILRRVGSFRWWTWVVFPVPLVAFGGLFLWSLGLTFLRGAVRWRGREVPIDRRPSPTAPPTTPPPTSGSS